MKITIEIKVTIDTEGSGLDEVFNRMTAQAQKAMTEAYYAVVQANFGPTGWDRPWEWAPLSDRSAVGRAYIQQVGRTYATLHLTGAMQNAVKMDPETGTVSLSDSDVPYATRHHNGAWPLPPRRVFPMRADGKATQRTLELVTQAAQVGVQAALR